VLWTTHLLDEVQPSDDLLILHQGHLVASGQADALSLEHGGDLGSAFARLTTSGAAR
jgi:ABC-2 type transport system ATP-binding protein